MEFSLFYFANDEAEGTDRDKYRLIMESARWADRNGFARLWTPERHFHSFGGLSPNPSVLAAALSACTERIQLCSGSVVLPPARPDPRRRGVGGSRQHLRRACGTRARERLGPQ
jgi:hypothetical protein